MDRFPLIDYSTDIYSQPVFTVLKDKHARARADCFPFIVAHPPPTAVFFSLLAQTPFLSLREHLVLH